MKGRGYEMSKQGNRQLAGSKIESRSRRAQPQPNIEPLGPMTACTEEALLLGDERSFERILPSAARPESGEVRSNRGWVVALKTGDGSVTRTSSKPWQRHRSRFVSTYLVGSFPNSIVIPTDRGL